MVHAPLGRHGHSLKLIAAAIFPNLPEHLVHDARILLLENPYLFDAFSPPFLKSILRHDVLVSLLGHETVNAYDVKVLLEGLPFHG